MKKFPSIAVFLIIAILSFFTGTGIATAGIEDVTYPVAELGGCESQGECRVYCDDTDNISECIAFAEEHDLMSSDDAETAQKFADSIVAGETPGGCNSPLACENYCQNISNINECLDFAEENGHEVPEVEEARKIARYLNDGGVMPGGCTSQASCETYCNDIENGAECLDFALEADLDIGDDDLDPEQMRRVINLMQQGESPGGCTSKEQCEVYCKEEGNIGECVEFGVKAGFIDDNEAELIRKTGGKGPGGCDSEESCIGYCTNPENIEDCFNFAREHDIFNKEDGARIEEGLIKMREALDGAPPEVASCIESSLGENIIAEINDGTFLPNADTGDVFRSCFENFYRTQPIDQTDNETGKRFNEFDNEDVDDPNRPHDENPDAALGDSEHTDRRDDFKNFDDFENFDNSRDDDIKDFYSDAGRFIPSIENLSPEAIACVVSNLGPTFETDIYSGNIDPSQVREVLQVCASDSTTSKFEQDISHDILPPEDTSENDFQFDKFGDEFIQNTDGQGFIPEDFQQGFQEVPAPAPEEYFEGASPTEYQDTPQQQSSLRQFMASTFQATIGLFGL